MSPMLFPFLRPNKQKTFSLGFFALLFLFHPAWAEDCSGPTQVKKTTANYKVDLLFPTLPDLDLNCEVRRDLETDLDEFEKLPNPPAGTHVHPREYVGRYQLFQSALGTGSVLINLYKNTGGDHPMQYTRTYSYDTATGKKLFFLDLFKTQSDWHKALWPFVKKTVWPLNRDKKWIAQGAGPDPQNYSRFTLDSLTLVLYFEPYAVAPYKAGTIRVKVPLEKIKRILATSFAQKLKTF
jgi:hypothetical protein